MKHKRDKWQYGYMFATIECEVYPIRGRYKIIKTRLDPKGHKLLFELERVGEPLTIPKRKKAK